MTGRPYATPAWKATIGIRDSVPNAKLLTPPVSSALMTEPALYVKMGHIWIQDSVSRACPIAFLAQTVANVTSALMGHSLTRTALALHAE